MAVWRMRTEPVGYETTIDEICSLDWENLSQDTLGDIARVYYYFSIQFRENLEIACQLYPWDLKLRQLIQEECNTDNLSPWPDVASIGERLNHDDRVDGVLVQLPRPRQIEPHRVIAAIDRPGRVIGQRLDVFESNQHVHGLMFDPLIAADRLAEGDAQFGVFDSHVEHLLCPPQFSIVIRAMLRPGVSFDTREQADAVSIVVPSRVRAATTVTAARCASPTT